MFFLIVLLTWTVMHVYVLARLASVPLVARYVPLWVLITAGTLLGASYIGARLMEHYGMGGISHVLEYVGANWVGVLFLFFICFLAVDVITGLGRLWPGPTPTLRTAAVVVAAGMAVIAFVQAWRTPVVTEYEVAMPGLPAEADGTVLVVASDMHLGSMLGHRWALRRAEQFASLRPDLLLLVGDIFEAEQETHEEWLPILQRYRAPKGVWVVSGNHELYAGAGPILHLFRRAGFRVLRDEAAQALPGLVIAGVDDIAFRGRRGGPGAAPAGAAAAQQALTGRPAGATVFLTHTPIALEAAAEAGAQLSLSGHTHNGQIWPFTYLVKRVFPYINGRYQVGGMTALVGRGTGTWGPRMRLWKRSELLRVTLRSRP